MAIVTSMPVMQRVEVYDEMARLDEIDFRVFYLQRMAYGRQWTHQLELNHDAQFVREVRIRRQLYLNPGFLAAYLRFNPDFLVMNGYYAPAMQLGMYLETLRRRPWVFWAEMAATRYAQHPWIGNERIRSGARSIALMPLRRFPTEIWAIGTRAQAAYRELVRRDIPVRNLPYFADLDRFATAGLRRQPSPTLRFLYCGSLIVRKGADVLAEAVEVLAGEGYEFELHIAGSGPLQECFDRLSERARSMLEMHGFLQWDQLPEVYTSADVLLVPSRHDGWGMALIEGLAAGLPVISTAQTGAAVDTIVDGSNGFVLPELSVSGLVDAMRFFLDHADRIPAMREVARATAEGYTHRVGARRFLDEIERHV